MRPIACLATMENSGDVSEGSLHRPQAVRKKTPIRAVFEDFTTAHSLITGSSKSNAKSSCNSPSAAGSEEAIPLQDMKSSNSTSSLPRLPAPTVVFHGRTLTDNYKSPQQKQPATHLNLRHPPTGLPMPKGKQPAKKRSHWPRDSLELKKNREAVLGRSDDLHEKPSASAGYEDDSANAHFDLKAYPDESPKLTSNDRNAVDSSPSLPGHIDISEETPGRDYGFSSRDKTMDFSTVGDIYNHYHQHDSSRSEQYGLEMDKGGMTNDSTDTPELPALYVKKHRQVDKGSHGPSNKAMIKASEPPAADNNIDPERPLCHPVQISNQDSQQDAHKEFPQLSRAPSSRNPYRDSMPPAVLVSSATKSDHLDDTVRQEDRLPLEKEVSQALRRASGYSMYSSGTLESSAVAPRETISTSDASASFSNQIVQYNHGNIGDARPHGFYDPNAVASNWVAGHQRNAVRVPINQQGAVPASPPHSPVRRLNLPSAQQSAISNDRDWETVGDSLDSYGQEMPEMLGFKQTGSSCADVSDEANSFVDPFGSTERIAHHPARMGYSGDYRRRELAENGMPVLLPSYGQHKVNGQVSDSMRLRSQPSFYSTPPPLARTHTNPFRTPPPAMGPNQQSSKSKPSASKTKPTWTWKTKDRNQFPPSRTLETIDSDDQPSPVPNMPVNASQRVEEWTVSLGEPGTSINRQPGQGQQLQAPKAKQRSSWQYIMEQAMKRDSVGDNNLSYKGGLPSKTNAQRNANTDGFAETPVYGGRYDSTTAHVRQRSVKMPPGAFYNGVRSGSQRQKPSQATPSRTYKNGIKNPERLLPQERPTNALRPLSLLGEGLQPLSPDDMQPRDMESGRFIYRSPLAPPARDSWQQLYTPTQMRKLKDDARAEGLYASRDQLASGSMNNGEGQSRKLILETPRLSAWSQEITHLTTSLYRKRKVSIFVLILCALFPPMLILYAMGYMDVLMLWWTDGEFSSFGSGQKRFAKLLLCGWGVLVFFAIIAIFVLAVLHKIG